jgi:F-type H+-transporting ATPase subunit delta
MAGEAAVLARRYARALYDLAAEQKQLEAVAHDLRALKLLLHDVPELGQLVYNPLISRTEAQAALAHMAEKAQLTKITGNFLKVVAGNRRLPQLGAMCDAFLAELAAQRGEHTAEVWAAQELNAAHLTQLESQLQHLAGGPVQLIVKRDASLLGGIMVKMGSQLIDASLKGKLARIERQLTLSTAQQEAA